LLGPALLCLGVALFAGLTAAIGILLRGDGTWQTVVSVRGETYDMAVTGVYAWNAQRVVAEGVGWDVFTLLIAVPALLVAVPWVARGSFRARLAAGGLLGYFLYQYLEYSVTWAFGPLFLPFVALDAASGVGIAWVGAAIARDGIQGRFNERFPRRAFATLSIAMAFGLTLLWLQRIAFAYTSGVDGLLMGETTMTVQALDLGLVVPVSLLIAGMALRGSPAGLALAAGFAITFTAMAAAITSMLLSAWMVEGTLELPPVVIFGAATVGMAVVALRIDRSVIIPGTHRKEVSETRLDRAGQPSSI
jgi:hypothetical protein